MYLCWPKEESSKQLGGLSLTLVFEYSKFPFHKYFKSLLVSTHKPYRQEKKCIFRESHTDTETIVEAFILPIIYSF